MVELAKERSTTQSEFLKKDHGYCLICGSSTKRNVSIIVWVISYFVFFAVSRLLGSIKVHSDTENFQNLKNTAIVMSNHSGILDPWIIFSSMPFKVFYKILPIRPYATLDFKKENKLLWFLKKIGLTQTIYYLYNVIAIGRGGSFEEKISPLVHAIIRGDSVLIFPEGSMSKESGIRPFKKGVVELYRRTNAPILPCVLRYHKRRPFLYRIEVAFRKPLFIPQDLIENDNELYEATTQFLQDEVLKLYES